MKKKANNLVKNMKETLKRRDILEPYNSHPDGVEEKEWQYTPALGAVPFLEEELRYNDTQ